MKLSLPQPASITLTIFSLLTFTTLKLDAAAIPEVDKWFTKILVLTTLLLSLRIPSRDQTVANDPSQHRPKSFRRITSYLMASEFIFALVLPWLLVLFEKLGLIRFKESHIPLSYIFFPHLFYFQVQIVVENYLFLQKRNAWVFPYTAIANSYRFFQVLTQIRRTRDVAVFTTLPLSLTWTMTTILVGLWAFSSLYFVPIIWFPIWLNENRESVGKNQIPKPSIPK